MFLDAIFGKKPQVATWKNQSPQTAQSQSITGNLANFGDIAKLGQQYTDYLTQEQNKLLPGYSANLAKGESDTGQLLGDASSLLGGNLPQDVIDQIQRSDAFGALSGGYAGSGMSRNLTARDLGLTSLDLMKQGASMLGQGGNSAQQWASLASGDIMNPAAEFVSPQQQLAANFQNAELAQQSQQFKYNVAAAPDPMISGIHNTIMSLLGAYLGGMGGGIGKGGGGQAGVAQYDQSGTFEPWYMNAQNLGG
jgi:hypothetical protein